MRPSLLLDFANTRRLDPRITFTRASVGTYFDRNGVLKTAPVNEPRFDYDPVTGYCKGLLIEEARTNLLTYSEQFDNAVWTKYTMSITANAAVAPDGTTTADKFVEDTSNDAHTLYSANVTATAAPYVGSIFVKAGERTWARVILRDSTDTYFAAYINLATGAVGSTSGSGTVVSVDSVGSGWYRVKVAATVAAGGLSLRVRSATGDGGQTYAGDGVSGLYVWGAQIELASFATSYIPTTSATVTRSAEVASITGAGFSPWFNPAQGTLLVAASRPALNATRSSHLVNVSDGTTANGLVLHVDSLAKRSFSVDVGSSPSCALVSGDEMVNAPWRVAAAYKADDFAMSVGGGAAVTDSAGPLPAVNQLWLGNRVDGTRAYNGHLAGVAYYPRRLANADLQELTR